MAEKAKLEIDIQANNTKALTDVEQGLDKIEKKGKSSGASLASSFFVLGGLFAGVSAAVGKTVLAFAESEKSAALLAQALKNTGNYSAAAMADLNNYASALQATTQFEDDSIIAAQSLIAAQGFHGQVLKDLTRATLDLATAKGMDLSSAADILAKSVGTENNVLARYGIEISGAADSTNRAYSAVKAISDLYGGQALAAGKTYEGQMASLKNQMGDVAETIGGVFAPAVLELAKILKQAVVATGNFISSHKEMAAVIIGAVVAFTGLAAAVAGVMAIMPVLGAAFAIIVGPVGWIVGGIIALIAAIESWGEISNWMKEKWTVAINGLAQIWEWFKNYLSERLETMKNLLASFGEMVWEIFTGKWREAVETGKELTVSFVDANKEAFDDLYGSTVNTVASLANGTVDIYNGLKSKITTIIGNIQTAWKVGLTTQTKDVQGETKLQETIWTAFWDRLTLAKATQAQAQIALENSVTNAFSMAASLRNAKTREMFEFGKAASIAQATIAGLMAIVQIWATVFQLGPIVGPIMGGVLSAMVAGITAYNISQIAATDMPAAEFGGIIPGSASGMSVLAGERGKSEAIIPLEGEGADRLRASFGGGESTVINLNIQNMFSEDRETVRRLAADLDEELEYRRQNRNSVFAHGLLAQAAT